MSKLRLPLLNAPTAEGKLEQLRRYLFQLTEYVDQLAGTVETHCLSPDAHSATEKKMKMISHTQQAGTYGNPPTDPN